MSYRSEAFGKEKNIIEELCKKVKGKNRLKFNLKELYLKQQALLIATVATLRRR